MEKAQPAEAEAEAPEKAPKLPEDQFQIIDYELNYKYLPTLSYSA